MINLLLIKNNLINFLAAEKIFSLPKKKKVVIYVKTNSEIFLKYINQNEIAFLDKNLDINIPVLLLSIFNCILYKSWVPYYRLFIKFTQPKCVLTYLHNDQNFYFLKKNSEVIYIAIQNGIILGEEKWIKKNQVYKVDYFLCFGAPTKAAYGDIINADYKFIGSFKNNLFSKNSKKKKKCLTFISQYKLNRSIKNFFKIENQVLPYLNDYCKKNGLEFRICGSNLNFPDKEKNFYQTIINDQFTFLPKENVKTSYAHLAESEINVSIDSTLGLESLACGYKTAIFMVRGKRLRLKNWRFGNNIEEIFDAGAFWCSDDKISEYDRVLNYLRDEKIDNWQKNNTDLISNIINYDYNNRIFLDILNKHNIPTKI